MPHEMEALIFDCDGVLVDTERDGHRVAFNRAFAAEGLGVEWSVDRYGALLTTGGGKERMRRHFDEAGWPEGDRDALIARLHRQKTDIFMELIEGGALPLRPGVARMVDAALGAGMRVAVCSTSNERAVETVVRVLLGPERAARITVFAGDVVPKKKPDCVPKNKPVNWPKPLRQPKKLAKTSKSKKAKPWIRSRPAWPA